MIRIIIFCLHERHCKIIVPFRWERLAFQGRISGVSASATQTLYGSDVGNDGITKEVVMKLGDHKVSFSHIPIAGLTLAFMPDDEGAITLEEALREFNEFRNWPRLDLESFIGWWKLNDKHEAIFNLSTKIHGIAVKSNKDVYVKEIGRKVALKRALERAGLTRVERTEVWKAYLGRKGTMKEETYA